MPAALSLSLTMIKAAAADHARSAVADGKLLLLNRHAALSVDAKAAPQAQNACR
jgi:hypothetical protein